VKVVKIFLAFTAIVFSISAKSAIPDQSYISNKSSYAGIWSAQQAQTFTVGINGTLTAIELAIFSSTMPPTYSNAPLQLYIISVKNGVPVPTFDNPLAYLEFTVDQLPKENQQTNKNFYVDLTAFDLKVTVGEQLAVVAFTNDSDNAIDYWWLGDSNGGYLGGESLVRREGFVIDYGIWGLVDYSDWSKTGLNSDATTYDTDKFFVTYVEPSPIPIPSAFWLFSTAIIGLFKFKRT
jgi:hypothetical protein